MHSFEFLPFEVTHIFFHLETIKKNPLLIVSCCNYTFGYEVDGSRRVMNLNDRVELLDGKLW